MNETSTTPFNAKALNFKLSPQGKNSNALSDIEQAGDTTNLTRLQLTFSVDRLLSSESNCDTTNQIAANEQLFNGNDVNTSKDINCNVSTSMDYRCCDCVQCLSLMSPSGQMQNEKFVTYSINNMRGVEELRKHPATPRFLIPMDIKTIVRPTPLRAVGNNNGNVPCSAVPPTSLFRLHYQAIQNKQSTTKPHNYLSSVIAPPAQLNTYASYAPTSVSRLQMKAHFNFDIPLINSNTTTNQRSQQDPSVVPTDTCLVLANIKGSTETNMNNGNSVACSSNSGGIKTLSNAKRKRSWSRAVFSNLQRKGLEIQFQQQKYITKPDRRKLAARLNLTDAQVKVWFQNRRMKWRHTRENLKSGHEKQLNQTTECKTLTNTKSCSNNVSHKPPGYSSDDTSSADGSDNDDDDNDDEIDVVE